jgi:hypothetical protein
MTLAWLLLASVPVFGYHAELSSDGKTLSVEGRFPSRTELTVDEGAERFIRDLRPCGADGPCVVRYRFLLAEAARFFRDPSEATEERGVVIAPPSTWLLRPVGAVPEGARARFEVTARGAMRFETGVFPSGADGSYELPVEALPNPPLSAFGPFRALGPIEIGGGRIHVARLPGALAMSDEELLGWIRHEASAVTAYFGRFPVRRALIVVVPGPGRKPGSGKTFGNGGASIWLPVGSLSRRAELEQDWVLAHEMVHLSTPNLSRRHLWFEEGIATYVEPLARAMIGAISPSQVFGDLIQGLPKGEPEPGDEGLDRTDTWGRTYWGGALFCFVADLEIRKRTEGRRGLSDALRGILAAGGDVSQSWSIEQTLAVADRGAGSPVLSELYRRMASAPAPVDLEPLFRSIGVSLRDGRVVFDDRAPLAAVRRSMTSSVTH